MIAQTAVIGALGMRYEREPDGTLKKIPHGYGVILGDDIDVMDFATVQAGRWRDTVVGDGCKIGPHVNVGHSSILGKNVLICGHATIGGSCKIGDNVTIWMNASIANSVEIGDDAVIGMGAVVLENVPAEEVWAGNPARRIR